MTARELKLKQYFPKAPQERIMKDYRCALFLDFHHPGHLCITQNYMYFYSTKNIQPPMPNPIAIFSPFKEIASIQKVGLDIIVLKKGDEEIVLDSFQFRNDTFDALQRQLLLAKGKSIEKLSSEPSEEYLPLDVETKTLMKRSIDGLPFFNDLGLLSMNYTIYNDSEVVFNGKETSQLKSLDRLKMLLSVVSNHFGGPKGEDLFKLFDEYFADAKSKSLNPPTVIEFLKKYYGGDDSSLVRLLKACIHPITAAIIRIKTSLTSLYPTKDKSWEVTVIINNENVEVKHLRHEECSKKSFQVQWKESLTFDRDIKELDNVSLFVTDLIFNPETREPVRYEIQNLLKDYLPAIDNDVKDRKTNTVLLPSFVDMSNQGLTHFPTQLLDMSQLQTLYLHFNKLDSLPDMIVQLTNLQVIYLNQNNFTSFPIIVCRLTQLQELHLGSNKITEIPDEIGNLENLRELSLSYNHIKRLPDGMASLKNLRKFYIHNNQLDSLPDYLGALPQLKTIQVHNNKLPAPLDKVEPGDSENVLQHLKSRQS